MKASFKIALLAGWLVAIIALFIGLYMFNLQTKDLSKTKSDIKISATGLQKAFEDNETTANSIYLNKINEVKGIIGSVKEGEDNSLNVNLQTENPLSAVICTFQTSPDPSGIRPGEEITIRGVCSGFLMDILLNNCVVVSSK